MKGALPIVDMGAFLGVRVGDAAAARDMEKACREFGFFYAAGHGVGGETVRALKEASARFFALPVASKMKIPLAARRARMARLLSIGRRTDLRSARSQRGALFRRGS
jgi:isopenicillin N synthase-like dioxygenase